MTGAQRGRDGDVTAGNLAVLADPLDGRSTLVSGETERLEVQELPGGDGRGANPDHPTVQEAG
jgi:hypothetical protein